MTTFFLIDKQRRQNAIRAIMDAPTGYRVTIAEPRRSSLQNDHFHAICGDLASSGVKWAGEERSLDQWKALLVSAHAVATGSAGEVIPGIEGEFVAIRESTAKMGVGRASSLIEYALAFCAQNGVDLKRTREGGFHEHREVA